MFQAEGTTYVNVGSQAERGTFEEEKEAHYCWRILARSWKGMGVERGPGTVILFLLSPQGRLNSILRARRSIWRILGREVLSQICMLKEDSGCI